MSDSDKVIVYRGRTITVPVSLNQDVSNDVITSQIRTSTGVLIATWTVTFDGNGTDGEIILTLDDSVTAAIQHNTGFMDLKRIHAGEPLHVFDAIEVEFRDVVTA